MNKFFLVLSVVSMVLFSSCNDDETTNPISLGASVTATNTFTGIAQTNSVETTIEDFFGQPAGVLAATATISDSGVEFPGYLLGLYDIDIDENSISFELVAQADDPTYMNFYRTIEAGTTDRYYLTFDEAQNVNGFTSSNDSVNLRIDSDRILVVEIGEGFSFNPGSTFTISLN